MNKGGLIGCSILLFAISFVAYVITIGVGWSLSQDVYPDQSSIFTAAAIITTISVFASIGFCCVLAYTTLEDSTIRNCAFVFFIIIFLIGSVFVSVGAILFIIFGAELNDGNSKVLAYGVSAGVFGLIAALSCSCSALRCAFSGGYSNSDSDT